MRRRSLGLVIVPATFVLLAAAACSSSGGSGGDYGPASDVQALRTIWQSESPNGKIAQVVVVGNYGIVDVSDPDYVQIFVKGASQAPGAWQLDFGRLYSGSIYGPVAACTLTERGVPQDVANQIIANDARLAAAAQQNPQAGCGS